MKNSEKQQTEKKVIKVKGFTPKAIDGKKAVRIGSRSPAFKPAK